MKQLLTLILLVSFCFGQFYYHILDEVEFYAGTNATPHPKVEILNANQLIISYVGSAGPHMILASYSYNAAYVLTKQDTLIHATLTYETPLARIDDTHMFVYQGSNANSHAKTYSIDGAGAFTKIDSIMNTSIGNNNSIAAMNDTIYSVVVGRQNANEWLSTFEIDDSYMITEVNEIDVDVGGKGIYNQIFRIDADNFFAFWLDDASDLGIRTGGYDGAWAATMIGSELEVNINAIGFTSVLMNDTTAVILSNYVTNRTYAEYYVVEWDSDFTNIAQADILFGGTLIMHDGYPALHRYNDTTLVALTGATGDTSQIRSFTLDGTNNLTSSEDPVEWLPSGNVRPDDIWLAAFDDSTIVAITKDTDNDMWMSTIRISESAVAPTFGWSHSINGVSTPTKVNSASAFTKVSGVE